MKNKLCPNVNKLAALFASLVLAASTLDKVEAAKPDRNKPSVVMPVITSVEPSIANMTLRITGQNFADEDAFVGLVEIYLAETGLATLVVDSFARGQSADGLVFEELLVSGLPANIEEFAGTHLLLVRKGDPVENIATFDVTIGAVGPRGADGADGQDGVTGPQGPIGPAGKDGADGLNGTNGIDGADGETGPAGPAGQDGVGVANASIDENGHLVLTLTDGSTINAGQVRDVPDPPSVFLDNFDVDTSLNYLGSGFDVSGGRLNIIATPVPSYVMHKEPFSFPVGTKVTVSVPDHRAIYEAEGLWLFTDTTAADRLAVTRGTYNGGTSHGYRFQTEQGLIVPRVVGTSNPVTFSIERTANDAFRLEVIDAGTVVAAHVHTDAEWTTRTHFYVGLHGYRDINSATVSYDNLQVVQPNN